MISAKNRIFRRILRVSTSIRSRIDRFKFSMMGQIYIDPSADLQPNVSITLQKNTERQWLVYIGKKSTIKSYASLNPRTGFIKIGKNCSINPFCVLLGYGGITIGDNVRIATGTAIVAFNHNFSESGKPIAGQGNTAIGITIEDDVWIGSGVRVLDGVTIGTGSVIGAGSVVNRSIPPNSVAVGVPAKVVKQRIPSELDRTPSPLSIS